MTRPLDTTPFRLSQLILASTLLLAGCKSEEPAQPPAASKTPAPDSKPQAPGVKDNPSTDDNPSAPTAVTKDNARGTAVIRGKAVLAGTANAPTLISIANDPVCEKAHQGTKKKIPVEASIVYRDQNNAVPYVFVYVKKGIEGKYDPPDEPVLLDQKGCQYHPHVFGMIAGQDIAVKNSDPTNHNVHSLPQKNNQFNFAQPNPAVKVLGNRSAFPRPEMGIKIKCDVHPWMNAWCHVMKHPFFDVTKDHFDCPTGGGKESDRGTFEIEQLPAGRYEIEAWHETLGTLTQTVTLADGEEKEIVFTFKK